jgi:hypothetical protein
MRLSSLLRFRLPPVTAWRLFVLLLIVALGSEYWDRDPIAIAGVPIPWPRFVLAMLITPLVAVEAARRWSALVRVPSAMGPLLVFWLCCALSVAGVALSPPGWGSGAQFARTLAHLSLYVLFVYVVVKAATWPRLFLLVRLYYAFGIAAACLAILQFVQGTFGLFPWVAPLMMRSGVYEVGAGLTVGFRASSIFGEPSWAARYYLHWMALALGFWWHTRDRRHLAALLLFGLAFYVANSLLGYVMLLVFAAAVTIAQMWRRNMFSLSKRQKVWAGIATYVLFLFWLAGAAPPLPDLLDRTVRRTGLVMQGGGGSGNRFDSIFAGLEVWKTAPIVGVGLGNISPYIVQFYTDPAYVFRSRFGSDSLYVQLLSETGIVGLAGFLWFWGRLLWLPRGYLRFCPSTDARQAHAWLRFLQVDLLAQAVGMLNYSDYLNPHLWTVVAIALACRTLLVDEARHVAAPAALPVQGIAMTGLAG